MLPDHDLYRDGIGLHQVFELSIFLVYSLIVSYLCCARFSSVYPLILIFQQRSALEPNTFLAARTQILPEELDHEADPSRQQNYLIILF
jgi:hypothetical protein